MARYFEIKNNTPNVTLDSQGRAGVQYTLKNVSGGPVDGRAVLVSTPVIVPAAGAVQNGWTKIDGSSDRHFNAGEEATFLVKIEVPQKDRSKTGNYTFRLDAGLVSVPDRGDEGPSVAFTVTAAAKPTPAFPLWVIPVVVGVLLVIGLVTWLVVRSKPKDLTVAGAIPDVTGKSYLDAVSAITAAKYGVDPNPPQTMPTDVNHAGKIASENPAAGTKAPAGTVVTLTIGVSNTSVPSVVGMAFKDAQNALIQNNLLLGATIIAPNPAYAGGVVVAQSKAASTSVPTNSAVDLSINPLSVTVPSVVGLNFVSAINQIGNSGLQVGSYGSCAQPTALVQTHKPAPATSVQVGSKVDVSFPCTAATTSMYLSDRTQIQRSVVANSLRQQQLTAPTVHY